MGRSEGALRFRRLASELDREMQALARVIKEASEASALSRTRELTSLELRGAADLLHDFYTGTEKALELIAISVDGGIPEGPQWHRRLLAAMGEEVSGTRPAVLSPSTVMALEEYLRFRHLFRSLYGFQLIWERFEPLLAHLGAVGGSVLHDLAAFRDVLLAIER